MVFLSPLFYMLFKYTRNIGMLILALLYFAVIESRIPGFSTTAFFFFGLGSYLALSKINLLDLASKSKAISRSEEHTSELQSRENLVCRLLLETKNHSI